MTVDLHRSFLKELAKLPRAHEAQFYERLLMFVKDRDHPILHRHPLCGKYEGHWSINVSGDFRALYCIKNDTYIFTRIGTHHQLYGN